MADLKNDIEKYLRGELTPAEMNTLERKALSDPFLADALEGAELAGAENFHADLTSLQASLDERMHPKSGRVISFWAWPIRIAAGLLVLAVSTFIIISLLDQNRPSEEIAQVKENAPPMQEDKSTSTTDSIGVEADRNKEDKKEFLSLAKPEETKINSFQSSSATPEEETPLEISASQAAGESKPIADALQSEREKEPTLLKAEDVDAVISSESEEEVKQEPTLAKAEKAAAKGFYNSDDKAKRKVAAGAPAESRSAIQLPKTSTSKVVRGKVTSVEDGVGLPGVNVLIKGTNTGTVTNADGYYQLSVEEEKPELVFSFIGLESKEVSADDKQEVDVAMNEDVSQLSEVVVVGYGSENANDEEERPTLEFATPAGGRTSYKRYLEKGLLYPEQALENNIEGKVTIQFTVQTTGELTDFKVIKGIGNGCDEEVIRLIKDGPRWAATKRNEEPVKDNVRVRMRFRLPKK